MNPVTQALLKQVNDPALQAFVQDWDTLNDLVIEIYQQKSKSFDQQELYFEVRERLRKSYAGLAAQLAPFWKKVKIKGELVTNDPFLALIGKRSAKEFVENWEVMKTLPAAREALNEMLMARIEEKR